jgi:hypothetical protein
VGDHTDLPLRDGGDEGDAHHKASPLLRDGGDEGDASVPSLPLIRPRPYGMGEFLSWVGLFGKMCKCIGASGVERMVVGGGTAGDHQGPPFPTSPPSPLRKAGFSGERKTGVTRRRNPSRATTRDRPYLGRTGRKRFIV